MKIIFLIYFIDRPIFFNIIRIITFILTVENRFIYFFYQSGVIRVKKDYLPDMGSHMSKYFFLKSRCNSSNLFFKKNVHIRKVI